MTWTARLRLYSRWAPLRDRSSRRGARWPWEVTGRDWLGSMARTVRAARRDDYGTAASAIAFSGFLALLPILGAIALTYGMITPAEEVIAHIRTLISILPDDSRGFIGKWLVRSITRSEGRETGLFLALALTLFSALRAGRTIIASLNTAYGVRTRRGYLRRRAIALLIVFGGAVLILGALFAIASFAWVERVLPPQLAGLLRMLRVLFWACATGGTVLGLALVYRYAPNRKPPPWRWVFPGAVAATALWLIATLCFGWYVTNFGRTGQTYGSVGSIVILQLWLLLSGYVLLLGARLNFELMRSADAARPKPC